jgi:hypothetical protein
LVLILGVKGDPVSLVCNFRAWAMRNLKGVARAMPVGVALLFIGCAIALAYASRSERLANHPVPGIAKILTSATSRTDPSRLLSIRRPLNFEVNRGQTARQVKYLAHSRDMALFLTADDTVLRLAAPRASKREKPNRPTDRASVLQLRPLGASSRVAIRGEDPMRARVNYFIGGDPSKWHTVIPTYAKVRESKVWPGVDLVW